MSPNPPDAIGAIIARPLVLPDPGKETKFCPLPQAIELALDDDFWAARGDYYDWVTVARGKIPLPSANASQGERCSHLAPLNAPRADAGNAPAHNAQIYAP